MSEKAEMKRRQASQSSIEKIEIGNGSTEYISRDLKTLDVALSLVAGHEDYEVTPEESRRICTKLDWHLLPLLFAIDTGEPPHSLKTHYNKRASVQFVDKYVLRKI